MSKIVDFSEAKIEKLIIHGIGNKSKGEEIILSSNEIEEIDKVTREYLMQYFISSFKFENLFSFRHQTDIKLNEIYNYTKSIFENKSNFRDESMNIANYLYEVSTHPNIKKGELYIAYIDKCIVDNIMVNAVGIFKSENKDMYINVDNIENEYKVYCKKGVNVNKLDKGCIIFNIDKSSGYRLAIVDSNNSESIYWKVDFLNVIELDSVYKSTQNILSKCKDFTKDTSEMQSTEKLDFLNKSLSYFQKNDVFNLERFSNDVFEEEIERKKFKDYMDKYVEKGTTIEFEISEKAVNYMKKGIKNYIKLDSSIEIRINSKIKNINQVVESGYDSDKNMKYYKIYYNTEE